MSIRSMLTNHLDTIVDARFKRDGEGRLAFYPWGFGTGRLVPDAATEARLRQAYRRLLIGIFAVAIPAASLLNGVWQPTGIIFIAVLAVLMAAAQTSQGYLWWLSRHLPISAERLSTRQAMMHSLDGFGTKFLVFGLAISVLFSATAVLMLVFGTAEAMEDPLMVAVSVVVFAPFAVAYALALWRRWTSRTAGA